MQKPDFRISRDSVVGLNQKDLCWAVVDFIWPDADIEPHYELSRVADGTPGQQAVYATMLYAQEVDNGGLKQFFLNSSGMYWRNVAAGLKLLDASEQARIFEAALDAFPEGRPSDDRAERRQVFESLSKEQKDDWRAKEDQIYRAGGFFDNLLPYWVRYIESHPKDFFI